MAPSQACRAKKDRERGEGGGEREGRLADASQLDDRQVRTCVTFKNSKQEENQFDATQWAGKGQRERERE